MTHDPHNGGPGDDGRFRANRISDHLHDDADSAAIKADIGRTRSAMDRTLDELAERLSPRRWIDDVLEVVKGSAPTAEAVGELGYERAREAGRRGIELVKRHPIPTVLILGGAAWLIIEQLSGRSVAAPRRRIPRKPEHFDPEDFDDRQSPLPRDELQTGLPPTMPPNRGSVGGRPPVRPPAKTVYPSPTYDRSPHASRAPGEGGRPGETASGSSSYVEGPRATDTEDKI